MATITASNTNLNLIGTSGKDTFVIPGDLTTTKTITIKTQNGGGDDTLYIKGDIVEKGMSGEDIKYYFDSTTLEIKYLALVDGAKVERTIDIYNYFKDKEHTSVVSTLKYVKVEYFDDESDFMVNFITNNSTFTPNEKNIVKGSPFGDTNLIFSSMSTDLTIYGGTGSDIITGSDGKNVIYGEAGNDIMTGGSGNDTITGGIGNNIINVFTTKKFGTDTVVLTENENLKLRLDIADKASECFDVTLKNDNKDLLITVYPAPEEGDEERTKTGEVYVKDFALKDVLTSKGTFNIVDSNENVILDVKGYFKNKINYVVEEDRKSSSYTVGWLNETIDASNYKKNSAKTVSGMKIVGNTESDNKITGSKWKDTITLSSGNDTVISSQGNDQISLGAGENTIVYTSAGHFGDTITVSKNEDLLIDLSSIWAGMPSATYGLSENNQNFEIRNGDSITTIKNIASKSVASTGSTSLKLSEDSTINVLTDIVLSDIVKTTSYTGKYWTEIINASTATKGVSLSAVGGNDTITGSGFNDVIRCGVNNVYATAGAGNDKIYLEAGNNTIVFGNNAGQDTI